jgi:hypothetical protein
VKVVYIHPHLRLKVTGSEERQKKKIQTDIFSRYVSGSKLASLRILTNGLTRYFKQERRGLPIASLRHKHKFLNLTAGNQQTTPHNTELPNKLTVALSVVNFLSFKTRGFIILRTTVNQFFIIQLTVIITHI